MKSFLNSDVEVYKRACIDRRLFSKIRSNPAYHPGKSTVLALVFALKLDIKAARDLLARAEYALSSPNKGDLIIKYFIEHQVYDLMALKEIINMSSLTKQERTAKIGEIVEKVTQMTDEQLGNIHEYTSDEFEEPNHEVEALNAVIRLSRKYGKNKDEVR